MSTAITKEKFIEELRDSHLTHSSNVYVSELGEYDDFIQILSNGEELAYKANIEWFNRTYGKLPWIAWRYGAPGIYVDSSLLPKRSVKYEEILDVLRGMSNYLLIDEDLYSTMESEAQEEAWEGWIRDDFVRALARLFEHEDMMREVFEHEVMEKPIRTYFYHLSDSSGTYVEEDGSSGMYINIDKLINHCTAGSIREYLMAALSPADREFVLQMIFDWLAEIADYNARKASGLAKASQALNRAANRERDVRVQDGYAYCHEGVNQQYRLTPDYCPLNNHPVIDLEDQEGCLGRRFHIEDSGIAMETLLYISSFDAADLNSMKVRMQITQWLESKGVPYWYMGERINGGAQ